MFSSAWKKSIQLKNINKIFNQLRIIKMLSEVQSEVQNFTEAQWKSLSRSDPVGFAL